MCCDCHGSLRGHHELISTKRCTIRFVILHGGLGLVLEEVLCRSIRFVTVFTSGSRKLSKMLSSDSS
jgi:hypothetical protein